MTIAFWLVAVGVLAGLGIRPIVGALKSWRPATHNAVLRLSAGLAGAALGAGLGAPVVAYAASIPYGAACGMSALAGLAGGGMSTTLFALSRAKARRMLGL